jgi:beta-glucosidase
VAQLYLNFPRVPGAPIHVLRAVRRTRLAGGETQHLSFKLDARGLSGVNSNGDRIVAAGTYRISVGGGQPGTIAPQAEAEFAISGERRIPD